MVCHSEAKGVGWVSPEYTQKGFIMVYRILTTLLMLGGLVCLYINILLDGHINSTLGVIGIISVVVVVIWVIISVITHTKTIVDFWDNRFVTMIFGAFIAFIMINYLGNYVKGIIDEKNRKRIESITPQKEKINDQKKLVKDLVADLSDRIRRYTTVFFDLKDKKLRSRLKGDMVDYEDSVTNWNDSLRNYYQQLDNCFDEKKFLPNKFSSKINNQFNKKESFKIILKEEIQEYWIRAHNELIKCKNNCMKNGSLNDKEQKLLYDYIDGLDAKINSFIEALTEAQKCSELKFTE